MSKLNFVSLVIDESSSMLKVRKETQNFIDQTIEDFARQSQLSGQESHFNVVKFAYDVVPQTIGFVKSVPRITYSPGGMTALYDGILRAIDDHQAVKVSMMDDVAHLIIVVTDGQENASNVGYGTFQRRLNEMLKKDNVTFAFNVPHGSKRIVEFWGVPSKNIREWEQTSKGMDDTYVATASATASYSTARSKGVKKVNNFYEVTTDLSAVTPADLKDADDVTSRFKALRVEKEQRIDDFVRQHTSSPYVRGTAFYQLTKPEEIQGHKDVLIKQKNAPTLYGGNKVRQLIGLQPYKTGKVIPGNHSNYDIFVQSTADNRKLVRGTVLMVVR